MDALWKQVLPQLAGIDAAVTNGFLAHSREITLPAHSVVFRQGDECGQYLLVLQGNVKVLTRALNGREIVLYRLGAGDSCVLTTSCLFGKARSPAEGVTESAVTALTLPASVFHRALQDSGVFREFVFQSFTTHLASVIALVEEVAFGRLDSRLARYLLQQCDEGRVSVFCLPHPALPSNTRRFHASPQYDTNNVPFTACGNKGTARVRAIRYDP